MPDPKLEPHFAVSCERFALPERVFLHNKAQLIRSLSRYAIVYSISNMVKNGPIHSSTHIQTPQPLYETRMFALTVSSRDSKLNGFLRPRHQLTLSLTGAAATALQFGSGVDSPNLQSHWKMRIAKHLWDVALWENIVSLVSVVPRMVCVLFRLFACFLVCTFGWFVWLVVPLHHDAFLISHRRAAFLLSSCK